MKYNRYTKPIAGRNILFKGTGRDSFGYRCTRIPCRVIQRRIYRLTDKNNDTWPRRWDVRQAGNRSIEFPHNFSNFPFRRIPRIDSTRNPNRRLFLSSTSRIFVMNPSPLSILRAKDRDPYTLIPEILKLNGICIYRIYKGNRESRLNVKSFRVGIGKILLENSRLSYHSRRNHTSPSPTVRQTKERKKERRNKGGECNLARRS